jgi:hypothetical protein
MQEYFGGQVGGRLTWSSKVNRNRCATKARSTNVEKLFES